MRALQISAVGAPIELTNTPFPEPVEGEVLVDIKAAALNHRDVWITKGQYPGLKFPVIPGSDGAGICEGKRVVLNPSLNWGDNPRFQGKDYHILGMPTHGTFAEQVKVPRSQVVDMPDHLDFIQAATLPLAGLTAYRCLVSRCQVQKNERVLISGVGGGVALFACQFALALGAEVFVTSGSDEKIEKAIELGAVGGVNYRKDHWEKELKSQSGGFDVVIDSAGGEGFEKLLKICRPGARVGIYGGTRGAIPHLNPHLIFWRQLSILGSTMGHAGEFEKMVKLVSESQLIPVVDQVFPFEEAQAAFDRMDKGLQFGKIVFQP
jgi:zinc-binding alcohol dehydrogenase/oxidoreductase